MARRRRADDEIERTRIRILESAARAFAHTGYRATTMESIASEAGYTVPTLYTYFKGKLDIYEGLINLVVQEVLATYDVREPSSLTFEQRLELLLIRQFEIVDQRGDVFAFFLNSATAAEGKPARKKKHSGPDEAAKCAQRLIEWMSDAVADSEIAGADPAILARFLMGITNAFLGAWVEGGRSRPAAEQIPTVMSLFFGGAHGLAAKD